MGLLSFDDRVLVPDNIRDMVCTEFGWVEQEESIYGYRSEYLISYFQHPDYPGRELRLDYLGSDFTFAQLEHKQDVITIRELYTEDYPSLEDKLEALSEMLKTFEGGAWDFLGD